MPILSKLIIWPVLLFFSFIFSIVDFSYADFSDMDMLVSEHDSVLVVDQQDRVVYSKNADKKLIPASTLKILTSLVAIHYMGSNFRYETEFYIDQYVNLKIKGYGDPLLISEIIAKIAENLKRPIQENSKKINNIVLDDSYFKDPVIIPGILPNSSEPYDAPNGALCANFNSVYFTRANDGNYISAEQQTPLLPFVLSRIKASSLDTGRIILSLGQDEATLYTGHLFRYFLQEQGIEVSGRIETGIVQKKKDRLIYTYVSEFSMEEIIKRLLY